MRSRSSLAFRGGLGAAWSWFAAFVGGMLWIASQAADPLAFWPILLATLGLGLLLAVDRHAYLAEALAGAGRESVLLLAAAWPLAAILAQTLRLSGLPASLVNIAEPLGLVGMPYVLAAFVLVATASVVGGSALAALALVAPLLYVTGDALGVATAPLAGALLAGAAFGDHLSPIAEVSVAAAITQRPNLAQLAATRLSWALAPGLASAVAFALLVPNPPPPNSLPSGDPRALLLLAAPALALWILRRRRHLVEATAFGAAAAVSIALLADRLTVDELLRFEGARLDGGLLDAAEQGAELSIVLVSIAAVMRVARSAGLPQSFFRLLRPRHPARAPRRRDEARLVLAMFGGTAMTVHPSGAALALGDEMRHTGRLTAVPALRRAHLLEVTIRALPFLLPWGLPVLLLAEATVHGAPGLEPSTPLAMVAHNAYGWAALATLVIVVALQLGHSASRQWTPAPTSRTALRQMTEKIDAPIDLSQLEAMLDEPPPSGGGDRHRDASRPARKPPADRSI